MIAKAKNQIDHNSNRKTVSLSFSVPLELENPINQVAAQRGMNRSEYLCWLVRRHLEELPHNLGIPQLPVAPLRIKKKR